jgi:ascorbate-specific PTS system EIIC-type component UlaA
VTTPFAVFGVNADGASTVASTVVFTGGPYDGIYQWDPGYYLSVHQIGGGVLIGTIYWVYTANPVQVGTRTVSEADTFDLSHGQIVGSVATMTGTRFYRGCTLAYDFTFNNDSSLTVRQNSVSNSPGVSVADVDCAATYPVGPDRIIPKIF